MTTYRQFHQHCTSAFFVQNFGAKNYNAVFWVWYLLVPKFYTKNVDEIDYLHSTHHIIYEVENKSKKVM